MSGARTVADSKDVYWRPTVLLEPETCMTVFPCPVTVEVCVLTDGCSARAAWRSRASCSRKTGSCSASSSMSRRRASRRRGFWGVGEGAVENGLGGLAFELGDDPGEQRLAGFSGKAVACIGGESGGGGQQGGHGRDGVVGELGNLGQGSSSFLKKGCIRCE